MVKTTDAHAWTEVYFPTFGWIRFEPTPGEPGRHRQQAGLYERLDRDGDATMDPTDPIIEATAGSGSLLPGPHANRPSPKPPQQADQPGTGRTAAQRGRRRQPPRWPWWRRSH